MTSASPPSASGRPLLSSPSASTVLVGLGAGLLCGAAAFRWPGSPVDLAIPVLEPLGAIWLAALQMLVLPLMVSMVIVSLGRAGTGQAGRLGGWTLFWFVAFLAGAAAVAVPVGQFVLIRFPIDEAARAALRAVPASAASLPPLPPSPTVRDWFVNLVPTNLARAAAGGDLLPLIVATLVFGAALRSVQGRSRELLLDLAQGVTDWCFALAGLLFRVLPFAVFVLTLASTARSGTGTASALVYYVGWLSAILAAATLVMYPLTAWLGRIPIPRFASALWPVQVLAFSTRSSVACLPAMLDAARRRLALPEEVVSVTLPFAVSAFKLNMGISANFQLLFLLYVYGLHPDPAALGVAVVVLALQSFATPGLPSGAIWTTTPVFLALGIPLEGVVLTNAVDTIPDLFKTTANVTADLSIAAIVARRWRAGSSAG